MPMSYVLNRMQVSILFILKLSPDAKLLGKEGMALNAFKRFGAVSVPGCKEVDLLLERASVA